MADDKPDREKFTDAVVVYATFAGEPEALAVAEAVVGAGLVACANIVPGIRSVFIWEGRLEREQEVAMLMKTRRALAEEVVAEVRRLHTYQNPAVVVFDVAAGSAPFLAWIAEQTAAPVRPVAKSQG